jgi:hypothetical protein
MSVYRYSAEKIPLGNIFFRIRLFLIEPYLTIQFVAIYTFGFWQLFATVIIVANVIRYSILELKPSDLLSSPILIVGIHLIDLYQFFRF